MRPISLCNASLRGADFSGADLRGADLRGTDLTGASLSGAILSGIRVTQDVPSVPSPSSVKPAGLANLQTDLSGVTLRDADLDDAILIGALLIDAELHSADLSGAILSAANLTGANLTDADLVRADLSKATLINAILNRTNLSGADLTGADLSEARIEGVEVGGAQFSRINLRGSTYQAANAPALGFLTGIRGLETVGFVRDEESGLILLRNALREAGLRTLEREATYAIESQRTYYMINDPMGPLQWIGGLLRYVFFEFTTGYGLYAGRSILIIVFMIIILGYAYYIFCVPPSRAKAHRSQSDSKGAPRGIYRVFPSERLVPGYPNARVAGGVKVRRLDASRPCSALGYALYFSLLSAFHIGWRDLNVGSWISRLQGREYALRARGWVRVVSGVQSLLSVYLLAIWVLTYFGRPFQ